MRFLSNIIITLAVTLFSANSLAIDAFEDHTNEPFILLQAIDFNVGEELIILEVNTQERLDVFIDSIVPFGQDLQIEVTDRHTGRHIILNIPYNP